MARPLRRVPVTIDGTRFSSLGHALAEATRRGFDGSRRTFNARLKSGKTTWADLIVPVDRSHCLRSSRGLPGLSEKPTRRAVERKEMERMIAELDARKRDIANRET